MKLAGSFKLSLEGTILNSGKVWQRYSLRLSTGTWVKLDCLTNSTKQCAPNLNLAKIELQTDLRDPTLITVSPSCTHWCRVQLHLFHHTFSFFLNFWLTFPLHYASQLVQGRLESTCTIHKINLVNSCSSALHGTHSVHFSLSLPD